MNSRVAVITGASSGIGASLARLLVSKHYKVVLAARREQELKQVVSELGHSAKAVVADVTRKENVEHLKAKALNAFGQIDIWVNNAGRGIGKKVLELTDQDFDEIIDVNLRSALYGMQVAVPYFQQQGQGHLINVSSVLSRVPLVSFRSIYSASKAALNSLTANLRMDLQADYPDIYVSLVMPGIVLTDFAKNALGGTPQVRGINSGVAPQTAEQVAEAIYALIEHPRAEIYTNPASADLVRTYQADIVAWEHGLIEHNRQK